MHDMARSVGAAHRQEGARTDMQGHKVQRDALGLERRHRFFREMQSCRGRGDRTLRAREGGLVVDTVLFVRGAARGDIGGKRHGAQPRDGLVQARVAEVEDQSHLAVLPALFDRRRQGSEQAGPLARAKDDAIARSQPLGGARQRMPAIGVEAISQGHGNAGRHPVALAQTLEFGLDDLGVVEDERIARREQVR